MINHDNHNHSHNHDDHAHNDQGLGTMQAGDKAIQSAFSVGLFLLKCLILIVTLVWLFSGVYKVENGECAVELFLGKIKPYNGNNVRSENLYFSLPPPFTEVIRIQVKKENSERIDVFPPGPNGVMESANDPLVKGYRNYYVTSDMNLLHLGWDITYRIKELDKFIPLLYEGGEVTKGRVGDQPWLVNSRNLIVQISRAVMMEECSRQKAMDILTSRNVFIQVVKDRIQNLLDKMGTGIELTRLSLVQVVPPGSLMSSFEEVLNSKLKKSLIITESQKKKEEILLEIKSEVKKIELSSQNDIQELEQSLKAETSRIVTINQLFKDNPTGMKNYLHQLYLETVAAVISDKSIEFIDRPENAIFKTLIFTPNKDKSEIKK